MFTGLIEGLGKVDRMEPEGPGVRLQIIFPDSMKGASIGDSVAINGCCLTIVEIVSGSGASGSWAFQAGTETLSRTNLGKFQLGDAVNLERSLPVSGRLGGHFVQGHIDGIGTIVNIEQEGEWTTLSFSAPKSLMNQMVSKGSIAIDGISLTLVDVEEDQFSVALIPSYLSDDNAW